MNGKTFTLMVLMNFRVAVSAPTSSNPDYTIWYTIGAIAISLIAAYLLMRWRLKKV